MPITPHANGEPLLKQSSSYINFLPVCNDSACCLSLVCKRRRYFQGAFVQVIVSSIQTSRARCTLYKKILDLLDEESFSGESSGRASL